MLYVPIDFVGEDEKAIEFNKELVESLLKAQTKIRDGNLPIHLGLKTTVVSEENHGWGLTLEGREEFNRGIARLTNEGVDCFVETWPSGPTRSLYGTLFDSGAIAEDFHP